MGVASLVLGIIAIVVDVFTIGVYGWIGAILGLSLIHIYLKNTLEVSKSGLTTQDLNGVFLNIKFQDGILSCTNGVSYRSFTLDHTFDQEWDLLIRKFFAGHDIPYTDIN